MAHYAEHGQPITAKQSAIAKHWEALQDASSARRSRLQASKQFFTFLSNFAFAVLTGRRVF